MGAASGPLIGAKESDMRGSIIQRDMGRPVGVLRAADTPRSTWELALRRIAVKGGRMRHF